VGHAVRPPAAHAAGARARQAPALSFDGRLGLLAGHRDLLLLDTGSGRILRTLTGHEHVVTALAFSADDHVAVSTDHEGPDEAVEPRRRRLPADLQGLTGEYSLALSADRHWLLVGHHDGSLQLWAIDWDLAIRDLLTRPQQAGYGWVRPDGVHRKLADLAAGTGGVMTGTTGQ
jgi:hypothetical protein